MVLLRIREPHPRAWVRRREHPALGASGPARQAAAVRPRWVASPPKPGGLGAPGFLHPPLGAPRPLLALTQTGGPGDPGAPREPLGEGRPPFLLGLLFAKLPEDPAGQSLDTHRAFAASEKPKQ